MCYTKQKLMYWLISSFAVAAFVFGMRGSRGGTVGPDPPPPENHKNIGFLGNNGQDPLENHKAARPAFNVGPYTVCWRVDDRPLIVVFDSSLPFIN